MSLKTNPGNYFEDFQTGATLVHAVPRTITEGDRLRVVWDLEELPEQAALPALILQPLLENAVYHGIETSSGPGTIHVSGRYRRNRVNISIRNTLPQRGTTGKRREGNAMALENTRQRLQGFFHDESQLTIGEVDGEYQVRVVFPYPWSP